MVLRQELDEHERRGRTTTFVLNGELRESGRDAATPLLAVLRNEFSLKSPRYGCGLGECGSCTVIIDGVAARSCVVPVAGVAGRTVVTLEGLATTDGLHPVQQAFVDEQAAQCGYCLTGMIMTAKALLDRAPNATEEQIRHELRFNLCRCGTHVEILRAVMRAAGRANEMSGDAQ